MRKTHPFTFFIPLGFTLFAMSFYGSAFAQALPANDLWLAKITDGVPGAPGEVRWKLMADYRLLGIDHNNRLAIHLNSKQIALVSDHVAAD